MQWNASHNIPISLSFAPPILGGLLPFSSVRIYGMDWVDRALTYGWDAAKIPTIMKLKGYPHQTKASAGLSFSTALLAMQFKTKKVVAIPARSRANFSLNYTLT